MEDRRRLTRDVGKEVGLGTIQSKELLRTSGICLECLRVHDISTGTSGGEKSCVL